MARAPARPGWARSTPRWTAAPTPTWTRSRAPRPPTAPLSARSPRDCGTPATDVVILWGERVTAGPRGAHAARALLNVAQRLGLAGRDGAGLLQIPAGANGRGLREAGVLPDAAPGLAAAPQAGRTAARDRRGRGRRRGPRAVPAAHRPARRPAGRRGVVGRAGAGEHGHRARRLPHGRAARARDRRLPRRVLRGEGGHDRASRRSPAREVSRRFLADRIANPSYSESGNGPYAAVSSCDSGC